MNYLEMLAGMNHRPDPSHIRQILWRCNRNAARPFIRAALVCLAVSFILQLRASAFITDDDALQKRLVSAIRDKRGYSNSVAVTVASMHPSEARGFLTAEIAIRDGQDASRGSVTISSDGRFYTEASVIPLRSATQSGVLEALKLAFGNSSSDIAITEAAPWLHEGLRHGYVYSTIKKRPMRRDYYLTTDGSALLIGDVYYLYGKREIASIATSNAHIVIGSTSRQSVLILFSDFQCPSCAELEKKVSLANILKANPGMTIFVREYPLPYHSWARVAALASTCAYTAKPEKYLSYREQVFNRQDQLTPENANGQLMEIAASLGFDIKALQLCMGSDTANKAVEDDIQAGDTIQIPGTPAAFLNGMALPAAWTIDDVQPMPVQSSDIPASSCRASSQSQPDAGCRPGSVQQQ